MYQQASGIIRVSSATHYDEEKQHRNTNQNTNCSDGGYTWHGIRIIYNSMAIIANIRLRLI